MKDDRLYLIHIRECLGRIERYTAGGRSTYDNSELVQDAVLRNLQTLAESTQRLSEGLKGQCPHVDWQGIAAFRNVLVHNYLSVDLDRVWGIVERDIPELRTAMQPLFKDLPKPPAGRRRRQAARPGRPRQQKKGPKKRKK